MRGVSGVVGYYVLAIDAPVENRHFIVWRGRALCTLTYWFWDRIIRMHWLAKHEDAAVELRMTSEHDDVLSVEDMAHASRPPRSGVSTATIWRDELLRHQ